MTITRSQTDMFTNHHSGYSSLEKYIYLNWVPDSMDVSKRIAFLMGKDIVKSWEIDSPGSNPGWTYSIIKTSSGYKRIYIRSYPKEYIKCYDNVIKKFVDNMPESLY